MSKQKIDDYINEHLDDFSSMKPSDFILQCFNDIGLANEWVSVEDRLPDEGEEAYMVTDGRYVNITEYDAEDERFLEIPVCALVNITHWMPLPLPPAEEA